MLIVLTYFWLRWVLLHIWLSFTIHYFIFHFKCYSILHLAVCQLLCWVSCSMKVIQSIISNISVPLSKSFNISLIAGIFPDSLKHAKVISAFKCDDKSVINNFCPISVLPIFSKVFEKLMYNHLFLFVDKLKILCNNQYSFRKQHSTYMALINIIDTNISGSWWW